MPLTIRVRPRLAAFAALLLIAFLAAMARPALAATPLTVAQAIATQNSTSQAVTGYVVGEPVSTGTVNRSNFSGDLAIALADSASETGTTRMLYVQLTTQWRSGWGLQSTPSRLGTKITVTGTLTAYFSHAGQKSPTAITTSTPDPDPTTTTPPPTSTTSSPTDTYYAPALGKSGTALRSALHSIIKTQTVLT